MSFTKKDVPDCEKCLSKVNCLYNFFDRAAQKTWRSLRSTCSFQDGEYLFNEGEIPPGLFIVCAGRVKIYKTSANGQQLISRIEQGGDLVGHIAFFAGGNFQSSGEVMGTSVVSLIDNALFLDFLRKHPDASVAVMRALALDVRAGDSRARDIAYKPARTRMADVIIKASTPETGKTPKFVVKGVKRRELAEMAGLTVETAVRILADFEKKKIIKRNGKEIMIMNKLTLDKIAASDI
ncbi:MAG: Crp/Fnr family transcriptional regulator [Elusimicrobiaceae bacterium]